MIFLEIVSCASFLNFSKTRFSFTSFFNASAGRRRQDRASDKGVTRRTENKN